MARIRDINRANRKVGPPKQVVWDYDPTPRQLQAHEAVERYKLYGGAMGGGKTVWLCAELLNLCVKYPGNRVYVCRHHLVDVKRSTLVTFEKVAPHGVIYRHILDDRMIELWNGSVLIYGGLGSQEEMERIKSTEFGAFGIDEATETFEEMFTLLCSRLRWVLPNGMRPEYFGLLASNPEPGWVKKRFVDNKYENHVFIPALPKDNPHLPEDYDVGLRKLFPEEAAKRYLDGSWDVFEGQVYKEFSREQHVYSHDVFDSEDSKHFDRFRVIDHGYRNPTCCLWIAVDFDGDLWVYDEHYESEKTIEEHAAIIKAKSNDEDLLTLCDPSMFNRTMQKYGHGWSPVNEYAECGIVCIKPFTEDGYLSEMTGINMVKQRFKHNTIHIHERCTNTIDEIVAYQWKKLRLSDVNNKNPEKAVDKFNHAVDNLRYATMWRPTESAKPKKPERKDSLHYAIMNHKNQLNREFFAGWSNENRYN